jgi:hypothetical protein
LDVHREQKRFHPIPWYLEAATFAGGYPPDLEAQAVQTALAEAEVMLREVAANGAAAFTLFRMPEKSVVPLG